MPNPAYTFSATGSAGEITASNTAAAEALGLTPDTDQLVFNLTVNANAVSSQNFSLNVATATDNVGFSTPVTARGGITLNLNFGVALTQNLSAQDAAFVQLSGLTVGVSARPAVIFRSRRIARRGSMVF